MSRRRQQLVLAAGFLACLYGAAILADRPGLRAEYFALSDAWRGEPVYRQVRPPRLERADDLGVVLHWTEEFSVRWTGWLETDRPGPHRFTVVADDTAYLEIGDELVVAGGAPIGAPAAAASIELTRGLHRVEIGLAQKSHLAYLQVLAVFPGEPEAELAAHRLWATRPGPIRRALRWASPRGSPVERRLLGMGVLLAGVFLLARTAARRRRAAPRRAGGIGRWRDLLAESSRVRRRAALVVAALVGVGAYVFSLRIAGSPLGFDDVRYMEAAFFTRPHGWMLDRFVHVYLVKAWQTLFAGDFFLAARHYWAFLAAITAAAMALGAFSLGPRLQLATLAATLWVAISQTVFFATAGAMWTDYTAMAFITGAVAILLHRLAFERPPRWELHALAVGALTLGAMRSKATGAVLLWLLLAFLWEKGRIDLRGAARKIGFWLVGVAAAQAVLMVFDARILGDAFFTFHPHTYDSVGSVHLNFGEPEVLKYGWIDQVWPRLENGEIDVFEFFPLGLLVAGALAAAAATRQRPERLVVHLLPFAFLGGLLLLQLRGTYGALPRHLFPMMPAACLLGGALFHHAGIDRIDRRQVLSPRFLVPLGGLILLTVLVLLPAANSGLTASELTPLAAGGGYESPQEFHRRALLPAALAVTALLAPLAVGRRSGRVLVLLAVSILLLADGTADTLRLGASRRPAQRGTMITYPWTVFADDIGDAREILVSPHLFIGGQRFFGPQRTAEWVARFTLRDPLLAVKVRAELDPAVEIALGSPADVERWEDSLPGLAATASPDPLGRIVLLRPRRAAESDP